MDVVQLCVYGNAGHDAADPSLPVPSFPRSRGIPRPDLTSNRNPRTTSACTMSLSARLQVASNEYQRLQAELSNAVEARQRLDAQLSENELVKKVRPSFLI